MLSEILIEIYERDLGKLKEQIEKYNDEADLWKTDGEILNSAGNLCLHLSGNLQHFFGAVVGNTGYVRDRDAEFADKDVSKQAMLDEIDKALLSVRSTLQNLSDEDHAKIYP